MYVYKGETGFRHFIHYIPDWSRREFLSQILDNRIASLLALRFKIPPGPGRTELKVRSGGLAYRHLPFNTPSILHGHTIFPRPSSRGDFKIAIICALLAEYDAIFDSFDDR